MEARRFPSSRSIPPPPAKSGADRSGVRATHKAAPPAKLPREAPTHESDAPPPMPRPRERLGRYVIVGHLGGGGMAEVDLALAEGPLGVRKLVAIKRPRRELVRDQRMLAAFVDELRATALLSHPCCVTLLEASFEAGRHYGVLEYVEGLPLGAMQRALARREVELPVELAVLIMCDVLDALDHVHGLVGLEGEPLEMIHRDVCPANVVVSTAGVAKLLDFGVARTVSNVSRTDPGVMKGRHAYIAPECLHGDAPDARADVWAAGVVLWELLAGRRLFRRQGVVPTLEAVAGAPIPPPHAIRRDVPPELSRIALRALTRDPARRIRSAGEMRHALTRWLATRPERWDRRSLAAFLERELGDLVEARRVAVRACVESASDEALGSADTAPVPPREILSRSGTPSHWAPSPAAARVRPLLAVGIVGLGVAVGWVLGATSEPAAPTPVATVPAPLPTRSSAAPFAPLPSAPRPEPLAVAPATPASPNPAPPTPAPLALVAVGTTVEAFAPETGMDTRRPRGRVSRARARRARASALRDQAREAFQRGEYRAAAAAYERAARASPRDRGLLSGLGASLLRAGDARGAVHAYRRAAALAPADTRLARLLADAERRAGL